jgi:Protein of unknown function (DUF559)
VHHGVYAVGYRRLTQDGRWMAAVLACGPGAVLSHRSAAQAWGIWPRSASFAPEVTRPGAFRGRDGIEIHRGTLMDDEVTEHDGIPITSIFRTIFDLAAIASMREVERTSHEAEVRRMTDRVSLPTLLQRYPGRRGATKVRRLLTSKEPAGITDEELEERFVAFLDANGFPRPLFNGTLRLRERLLRPDCMWPRQRLIVELDGRAAHGTDRAFESDRKRDRELLAEGWRSIRVTWRQLRDEPDAIAADLRGAVAEKGGAEGLRRSGEQSRRPHPPSK